MSKTFLILLFHFALCSAIIVGQGLPDSHNNTDQSENIKIPGENTGNKQERKLPLSEAVRLALENNREIEISRQNVRIAETERNAADKARSSRMAIEIAQHNVLIADVKFRQTAINIISEVQLSYWELVYAMRDWKIHGDSLQDAKEFLASTQRYINRGQLNPIDREVVDVQMSNLELAYFDTQNTVIESENALKYLIAANKDDELWNASIIPTDPIEIDVPNITLQDAVQAAITDRPEIFLYKYENEINQIKQKIYKVDGKKNPNFVKTQIQSEILQTQYNQIELKIKVDVQNTYQKLKNAQGRLMAAARARENLQSLNILEEKRLETGESTTQQVQASRNILLNARLVELRASTELVKAIAQIQRATAGTLQINQ